MSIHIQLQNTVVYILTQQWGSWRMSLTVLFNAVQVLFLRQGGREDGRDNVTCCFVARQPWIQIKFQRVPNSFYPTLHLPPPCPPTSRIPPSNRESFFLVYINSLSDTPINSATTTGDSVTVTSPTNKGKGKATDEPMQEDVEDEEEDDDDEEEEGEDDDDEEAEASRRVSTTNGARPSSRLELTERSSCSD